MVSGETSSVTHSNLAIPIRKAVPIRLRTLDSPTIQVVGTLPDQPIAGVHLIARGGSVNLGISYGAVKVSGMTVEGAKPAIEKYLGQLSSRLGRLSNLPGVVRLPEGLALDVHRTQPATHTPPVRSTVVEIPVRHVVR